MRKKIAALKADIKNNRAAYTVGGIVVFVYGSQMVSTVYNFKSLSKQYDIAELEASK